MIFLAILPRSITTICAPVVWDASSVFFANASASVVEIFVPSNRTIVSGKTGFFVSFADENTTDMNVIESGI